MAVMLAYVMLVSPATLQQTSEATAHYSRLYSMHWAEGDRTIEYGYDANGSLTQKLTKETSGDTVLETVTYEYNLQNRLASVITTPYVDGVAQTPTATEYRYDPDGVRIGKTLDDGTDVTATDYLIDAYNHTGYAQVFKETTGSDTTVYIIGDDVLGQAKGADENAPKYLLYDGHGSTRQLVNNTGATVLEDYSYDAYGVMLGGNPGSASNPDAPATNLLYAGEQFDSDAQQYYLRARYYDPLNGRFNRTDPFAGSTQDPQSLHKYLYCHANPVNNVDPSGKISFTTVGTLITIAIWAFLATVALTVLYVAYLGFRLVQKMRLISGCPFLDVEDHLRPAVRQMKNWPPGHRMQACAKWLEPALEPGYEANNHVKVFPGDENDIWGMHAEVSPYVFVCQWVVDNRNDLELALIIFAEWQHSPAGDDMEEGPAQAEFERVREDLRRTGEITDFIESLTHGDQQ